MHVFNHYFAYKVVTLLHKTSQKLYMSSANQETQNLHWVISTVVITCLKHFTSFFHFKVYTYTWIIASVTNNYTVNVPFIGHRVVSHHANPTSK